MTLKTERLILRRWEDGDAEDLYKYASNPDVGPIAGWPPHQSIEESRDVIRNVFSGKEAYAICLKEDGKAIGAIELKLNGHTDMTDRDDECEMGYWLGKPFWGQGIMPEAVKEMFAGLQISIYKPFDVGSRIEFEDGTAGVVESMTLRHVVISLLPPE